MFSYAEDQRKAMETEESLNWIAELNFNWEGEQNHLETCILRKSSCSLISECGRSARGLIWNWLGMEELKKFLLFPNYQDTWLGQEGPQKLKCSSEPGGSCFKGKDLAAGQQWGARPLEIAGEYPGHPQSAESLKGKAPVPKPYRDAIPSLSKTKYIAAFLNAAKHHLEWIWNYCFI